MNPTRSDRRDPAESARGGARAAASAAAYRRLHTLIVEGVLAAGSPLVESDVCARLGVSRTPVRAALLRLEQEGLVRGTAGGSARAVVSPLTAGDLREIFLMLGALEATAGRHAAGLDAATRDALAATLREANARFRAAVTRRPPELATALAEHRRFHHACVDAAAGPRLRTEIAAMAPQAERYLRVYSAATIYAIDEMATAHETIAASIRAGDAEATERGIAAAWRLAADRHGEMLAALGERGNW